jgi:hypothetical protein
MIPLTGATGESYPVAAAVLAVGLATIHLLSGRWEFVDAERRRQFLSFGGGASVAYVFVLMLPEVSETAFIVGELRGDVLLAEQAVFVLTLLGFVVFYGIEVGASRRNDEGVRVDGARLVYWLHLFSFAVYSGIIGYLLFHQEVPGLSNLVFYAVAMGLHFAVTDYGFHRHYGAAFDDSGKLLLAGGTVVGALSGFEIRVDVLSVATLFAFVAGGVVFNVVKEELPSLSEARFGAFVVGALVFVGLLVFA